MASLNLSINGPAIRSSYNGVVNGASPNSNSSTYARWALFSVQAPLVNAFQDSGPKESVLNVQGTGEGELLELIEDFSEGRVQFAFVKVIDPNTALPKHVLIAWCGGGVPERTKGYFTSHINAVSKVLHGYHVQITARSDSDLEPDSIIRKVADASGAKYSSAETGSAPSGPPPVIRSKPVFTPTSSTAGRTFDPLVAARSRRQDNVDEDGWGADAPPVTRSQIEKVESAYKPTKVDMAQLSKQPIEPSRFASGAKPGNEPGDVVRGGYQPIGRVDIAAIRAQAKSTHDDRPTIVKGAYEPVGKVDIAAIRAKAQKPAPESPAEPSPGEATAPKPLAERAAAFSQPGHSERITSLPKPKIANKFSGASTFTGTKAPVPSAAGFGGPTAAPAAPISGTSRTFANEGGKTPAQLWEEKKARERGPSFGSPAGASPIATQKSGNEWKSGYAGKSWAPVQTSGFGRDAPDHVSEHATGASNNANSEANESSTAGGIAALRDKFKSTAPMGSAGAPSVPKSAADSTREIEEEAEEVVSPPVVPSMSRPSGGFALPGLPSRSTPVEDEEEEEDDTTSYQPVSHEREQSPIRVAQPVSRSQEPEPAEETAPAPPPAPIQEPTVLSASTHAETLQGDAAQELAHFPPENETVSGDKRAVIIYDYAKDEGNEIDLVEGEMVTNIEMVDPDWWMGTNSQGESGLFPSAYVELVEGGHDSAASPAAATPPPPVVPAEHNVPAAAGGATATALYDYEAAEDNELSFTEGSKITDLEFPDEDWWYGHYNGQTGLFPSNHVQRDS